MGGSVFVDFEFRGGVGRKHIWVPRMCGYPAGRFVLLLLDLCLVWSGRLRLSGQVAMLLLPGVDYSDNEAGDQRTTYHVCVAVIGPANPQGVDAILSCRSVLWR